MEIPPNSLKSSNKKTENFFKKAENSSESLESPQKPPQTETLLKKLKFPRNLIKIPSQSLLKIYESEYPSQSP